MKISGFTFVRNAIKYDYPIVESIKSIIDICDEFVVLVGNSDDDTLNLIKSINSDKIKIFESVWDDNIKKDGKVLAVETNKALAKVSEDTDWAFYLQADEVIHEKHHENIIKACKEQLNNAKVDGLLFKYTHFYGSYDYIGASSNWYRNEIRVIKRNNKIYSYKDAQGFRKDNNKKLNVKVIDAQVYHYGWVKPPEKMKDKLNNFHALWHSGNELEKRMINSKEFNYSEIDALNKFTGTHPKIMQNRINNINWKFDYDISFNKKNLKEKIKNISLKLFGKQIGEYKNYKII